MRRQGERPQSFSSDVEAYLYLLQVILGGIPRSAREAWLAAWLPRTFAFLALSSGWGDLGGGVGD